MSKRSCRLTEKGAALKEQSMHASQQWKAQKKAKSSNGKQRKETSSSESSDEEPHPQKRWRQPDIEEIEVNGEESGDAIEIVDTAGRDGDEVSGLWYSK